MKKPPPPPPPHSEIPEPIFDSSQSVDPAILNMMLGWGGASYTINESTIIIFIHYKPRIAVAIIDL